MRTKRLVVESFGPIRRVDVPLSDLTVLVGPRVTGKSLVLRWLKLVLDRNRIAARLSRFGFDIGGDVSKLFGLFLGGSYRDA